MQNPAEEAVYFQNPRNLLKTKPRGPSEALIGSLVLAPFLIHSSSLVLLKL